MNLSIQADARHDLTKSEIKQLRAQGKTPASVYGKKIGNALISVDTKELTLLLRQNPNAILQMNIPEQGKHPVMIHEIQRDTLNGTFLHVDFHQINMNDPIKAMVPIEITGEPKGVVEGGILQVQMRELEIICLPKLIPSSLPINVNQLEIGEKWMVSDIQLPKCVELVSEIDDVVLTVTAPQSEEQAALPTIEVEPELVGAEVATIKE